MTRDEAHEALTAVADAMRSQHGDQDDRLHQLVNHLATAHMAIDHLFDESEKEGGR